MAENVQKARVDVFLNGEAANRELQEMKTRLVGLKEELHRLETTPVSLLKPGEVKKMEELRQVVKKTEKSVESLEEKEKAFARTLKNINSASLKDLQAAARRLSFEVKELTPGTQAFIEKSKQLQQVNTRIVQLRTSFKGLVEEEKTATFSLKGLADGFNKYFGMVTAGVAAVTGLSMAFRKCAEEAAKLDDTYADVMKTTGLLHEEVANLDQELMKIDTRTSREQLLLLARDAGKLGIQGRDNILGFVRAADQIQVALGEDLGEGAIKNLGKIADVLGYTQSMGIEKSLLSIASSINAVGQASTASEAYLVDFTQRLAGVAAQTNISAANIIGFASGLDQSAMKVEMAATAFQKFLMKLYEDPAKFAAYANLEVEKFTDLLQNDANQAIITILKALKDQDGFASLVPIFKDLGLDGARAVSVLAAMATNINAVTEAQKLANVEFDKATSVTEEYNTKNNNLQANLEKARKEFQNATIALGQSLNPVMLKSTKLITYLIKALATYGKEIRSAITAVVVFTALVKASAILQATYNVALKATNTLMATWKTIVWAVRVAFYKLIGAQEAATIAQQQLNAAMSSNVFGLLATAVAMVTVAIARLIKKQREAAEAADWERRVEENATKAYAEEAATVKTLTKIIESNNVSLDSRKKALDELKKIVPGYHADLTEEGKLIHNNTEALTQYIAELRRSARIKARREDIESREKELMELEDKLEEAKEREAKAQSNMTPAKRFEMQYLTDYEDPVIEEFQEATAARKALEEQIASLTTIQEKAFERLGNMTRENAEARTEEESAIRSLNQEYKHLFNEINETYRDNPQKLKEETNRLKEEQRREIAEIRKKYAERKKEEKNLQADVNTALSESQFDFLKERYDSLTKKEKAMVDKGYASLSEEESKALSKRYAKLTKLATTEINKEYKEKQKAIEQAEREQENIAKQQYTTGILTEKQYEDRLREIKVEYLQKKIDLAQKYAEDETTYQQAMLDAQLEAQKLAAQEMDRLAKEADEKLKKEHDKILEEKRKLEELTKEGNEVRASLRTPSEVRNDEMAAELARLDKLHQAKQLSEEEYEKAVKQLRKKYAEDDLQEKLDKVRKYTDKVNSIMAEASNVVSAIKDAELAKAEANYQKELTAAGDNAEKREEVESQYEQKKLEIQKKYADADMAINIAKTIAAGALAAIQAFAQLGPIGGAVAAAMIAVATAAEVATIVQQRNAIKNSSVNRSGSSSSTPNTGERKITGYSEGGDTPKAASDKTPVGIVHANEWVAPAWMKRREPVLFANLEQYRKTGGRVKLANAMKGFAEGGFTSGNASGTSGTVPAQVDIEAAVEAAIRRSMADGAIRAYLVRRDLEELDAQTERFKKQTKR